MPFNRIVISSGHGKYVRGASGVIDEVDEARRVVERVANELRHRGVDVVTYHDDVSKSQSENLNRITDFHNSKTRDLDISVHFNAYVETAKPMGTEVLYVTQGALAAEMSSAIAACGFLNRGAKKRTDLHFLNSTEMPALLLEVCFVDSEADCETYGYAFDMVCENIASVIGGGDDIVILPPLEDVYSVTGKVSMFGGPDDDGISASEGLAFIDSVDDAPQLFLPYQPEGTTGLARRLNPYIHYIACRWNYDKVPKSEMTNHVALVRAVESGIAMKAFPADWGPHQDTGRVADISPGLMMDLGIDTDDEVEVIFPYMEDAL
jgi:N-acetylmuramoyl-L-alanine amidase